jgi:hypothetical protein
VCWQLKAERNNLCWHCALEALPVLQFLAQHLLLLLLVLLLLETGKL